LTELGIQLPADAPADPGTNAEPDPEQSEPEPVQESRTKELAMDLEDPLMSDEEFETKYGDSREAMQGRAGRVQDRRSGEWYDPAEKFDQLKNSPEFQAQMKRMAQREDVAEGSQPNDIAVYHHTGPNADKKAQAHAMKLGSEYGHFRHDRADKNNNLHVVTQKRYFPAYAKEQGVAEGVDPATYPARAQEAHEKYLKYENMVDQELRKLGQRLPQSWDAARMRQKLSSDAKYALALKYYDLSEKFASLSIRYEELAKKRGMTEASGCNHTMEGEMCPEHGLAECGMHESQVAESQEGDSLLARIKSLALLR
jgi:hypothetical protein